MAKPKESQPPLLSGGEPPVVQTVPPVQTAPEAGPPAQPAPNGPPVPKGFEAIATAPKTGVTLKLWFGTDKDQMDEKFFVLGRWRKTRKVEKKPGSGGRWVDSGHWVSPSSNMPIGFEFTAWQPTKQVTQQDIDASNFAVNQERERRAKAMAIRDQRAGS